MFKKKCLKRDKTKTHSGQLYGALAAGLTSCASILYSSSLVTEIRSLSVLSTTTITNYDKITEQQVE